MAGEGPAAVVEAMRDHLRLKLKGEYPKATFKVTKRAILIAIHEPLPSGEDPTVDLVVALDRANAPGLWIPNAEQERWDSSDPEEHTRLLTAAPKALRVTRARAIRLAKAENKRTATPPLCSFNLEALGLMFVTGGQGETQALLSLWREGAGDLTRRLTPDPADVSAPIKVADRDLAVKRLRWAADVLADALAHDDNEGYVRRGLAQLWPDFVATRREEATKARAVAASRSGSKLHVTGSGVLSTAAGTALKQPRSYGDRECS
jgi:hypothetical protein